MAGRAQDTHEYLYWELGNESRLRRGLRVGNWKAVWMDPKKPIELFDLTKDESETTDVAQANPDIAAWSLLP